MKKTVKRTVTAFCAACGEKKRLTYPQPRPICCTQACAAMTYANRVEAGMVAHCPDCGGFGFCTCDREE